MISQSQFDSLNSFLAGRLTLINLANQMIGNVVDRAFVNSMTEIIRECKNESDLRKALFFEADSLKFHTQELSGGHMRSRLVRVSLWPTILNSITPRSSSADSVSRIKDHLATIQERQTSSSLIDDENAHRAFFERRYSSMNFLNKGWMNANLNAPISLKEPMVELQNPVFCTFGDGEYEEANIFNCADEKCADSARDILGLVHFDNSWYEHGFIPLGAIAFDFDSSDDGKFARPTIVEAGTHSRFKSTYGRLEGSPGKWGRAFDLSKMDDGSNCAGGREIAVNDFTPSEVWITFLGFVRVPRGDVMGHRDNDFLQLCLNSQSDSDIQKNIERANL